MAGHNNNPFYTGDDSDDHSFGSRPQISNYGGGFESNSDPFRDDDEPIDFVQIQQNSMNRQLESTQKCLASIYDSEAMGVSTAEELVQQGEQLNNVEHKLDTINQDMKTTQKHLNNIKSVFGGIKNWWHGKKEAQVPDKPTRESKLEQTLNESQTFKSEQEHPALKMRSEDYNSRVQTQSTGRSDHWQRYEEQLEDNLGAMSAGLSRLKGLGVGLGQEIETQNAQIERVTTKSERADVTIKDQNRQMKHILGK